MDIFEERSGLSVKDVLATQKSRELKYIEHEKDEDFVLPVRFSCTSFASPSLELTFALPLPASQKAAKKEKVANTKAGKGKKKADTSDDESDAESTDSEVAKVSFVRSELAVIADFFMLDCDVQKRKRPSKTQPAGSAAKGKGKQKQVDSDDESDEEPKPKRSKKAATVRWAVLSML